MSVMCSHKLFSTCFVQPMRCLLVGMILVGMTTGSDAQEIDPQNFVIENAYIALADAEDVPINLLIRDNELELISKDEIPIPTTSSRSMQTAAIWSATWRSGSRRAL